MRVCLFYDEADEQLRSSEKLIEIIRLVGRFAGTGELSNDASEIKSLNEALIVTRVEHFAWLVFAGPDVESNRGKLWLRPSRPAVGT